MDDKSKNELLITLTTKLKEALAWQMSILPTEGRTKAEEILNVFGAKTLNHIISTQDLIEDYLYQIDKTGGEHGGH